LKSKIYLTFDIDWLCDEYLSVTLDLLNNYGLKATFFATHKSQLLYTLDKKSFEIGLHPNFDKGNGQYDLTVLSDLKELYPEAVGTRSHTLFFSSRVLSVLDKCSLKYESNIFLLDHLGLKPTRRSNSIVSLPFNWSDDKHVELARVYNCNHLPDLRQTGLNIFNFHPVHIYLNTNTQDLYEKAKPFFNQKSFSDFINNGIGIKSLFIELCEKINQEDIETCLLRELLEDES
jgi:hypothetical protein